MGTVTGALASFGAVSPLVGSLVTAALGWRAALVLPVLALLAVPAAARAVPGAGPAGARDPWGVALLVVLFGASGAISGVALPAVGWARIRLGRHEPAEVLLGALVGACMSGTVLAMLL